MTDQTKAGPEVVAYLHRHRSDSDVVTSAVRNVWNGVVVGRMGEYSIPLVRQSDAEAIIAGKDAEIERLRAEVERLQQTRAIVLAAAATVEGGA